MKKQCLIVTSNGRKTFTPSQLDLLDDAFDASFLTIDHEISEAEFVRLCADAEYLAITRRPLKELNHSTLSALRNLRAMAVYSTGYEWIDVDYLSDSNIPISFLPDYSTITVAEHTIAMLLTLSRRTHLSMARAEGELPHSVSIRGWELRGKQIGIIGYGRIGSEIAALLQAFGCHVSYYDKNRMLTDVPYTDYDALLSGSDIVVLASSSCPQRKAIIRAGDMAKMKRGAFLVNPARASLVDNMAVIDALKSGQLAGYAVDDTIELFNRDHGLDHGRIVQTAHTAWYSTEAIERGTEQWVRNILALGNEEPINLVSRHA